MNPEIPVELLTQQETSEDVVNTFEPKSFDDFFFNDNHRNDHLKTFRSFGMNLCFARSMQRVKEGFWVTISYLPSFKKIPKNRVKNISK